ncbi:family 43 glycosylhydrolase [Bifidobacterium sp. SMB2]|uniref:Family 43 glycosylhydrolase n=1 Tax=Bifidobacterium saimiriisciurei TaxID=2661627 RepID=A0ABX0CAQ8_9BIFI|nr:MULTISPECIES: family 43 glycosylhydrolase [Bifidobacterium]NEG95441.1 family 43 glycosylhydrolase [Bifidobacterium sp. SMB2]NEH12202.1 family 43 glycosylhydrolase [Bifidobacterium saimiriisciurei]
MGNWKKVVAAMAAVPMLATLVPAANAAEATVTSDSSQSQSAQSNSAQAQQALQAALKSNAKTASATAAADMSSETSDYLFAHFTGTERNATDEQMYFATSKDGLSWHDTRDAGDPVLSWTSSQTGNSRGKDNGVRDPYLVRSPKDGKIYLIATELSIYYRGGWGAASATTNGSTNLIIWESTDLVNWSQPRAVDVASKIPGAGMAWAPEAYWDDANQQFMVYWATASDQDNESGDRTNMYYSTTKDFKTFTDPVKWIDRSKSVIDTTMLKADDGYYYRVSGDTYLGIERSKNPYATTLTTGTTVADGYYNTGDDENQWTLVGTFGDLTGTGLTGAQLEGPELFFYNSDDIKTNAAGKQMKYGLMWDQYAAGKGYTPYRSADLGSTDKTDWGYASDVNFGSLKKRHGTILPITTAEYDAVMKAYDKNKAADPVEPDADGAGPIAEYTFEDGKGTDGTSNKNDLTFKGNATVTTDAAKGKVLTLDGASGTYAEFPKGLFDGRNKLTVQMDVKSETAANTNQFTFAFGKNNQKYYFMKYNKGSLANRITVGSYGAESKADSTLDGDWHKVTVVFDGKTMTSYVDGKRAAENTATSAAVSDLGKNLIGYLGKSFYNDPYFKGSFDNVKVWNRALAALEIADSDTTDPGQPAGDVLADFTFDDLKAGATGDINDAGSAAKATIEGTAAVATNDGDKTTAAKVGKDFWLNVTKADGTPLLKGVKNATISYDVKPDASGNTGWTVYAAENTNAPVFRSEKYLGVLDKTDGLTVQRYVNSGSRDESAGVTGSGSAAWHNVTITLTDSTTKLYVDGSLVDEAKDFTGRTLADILGADGGILQLGKANWGSGEYFSGLLDNVKIYGRELTAAEIAAANPIAQTKLSVEKTTPNNQVLSQKIIDGENGEKELNLTLDYWAPNGGVTGEKTDKSKLALKFKVADGSKVTMADGSALPATQDLTKDFKVKVTAADGKTSQVYDVTAQVLVTPIRVAGEKAPTGETGRMFFADPQVVAYGGKYYIFPTTDGSSGWQGHEIHVFESSDMANWEDKGVVVDLSKDYDKMPDSRKEKAWAPGFAVRDGKFYLYFSGNGMVNVAISDPAKGGTITSGYEIQKVKVESSIDPAIFEDPATGKWYLAWGQSPGKYAELNDDMTGIKAGTTVTTNATRNMREGSYITSRPDPNDSSKNIYYYSYSIDDTSSPNYRVAYAWVSAKSLDEVKGTDWQYGKDILVKDEAKGILGTAHHSIVQVPGTDDWYIVYHAFLTDEMRPRGYDSTHGNAQLANGNKREVRIARMTYDKDGQINVVPVTYEGVLPETTPAVSVAGAASGDAATKVGTKLTASFNDGWKLASVQWYRADKADGTGETKIAGATAAEYTLTNDDAGKVVYAKAIGENTTGVLQNAQPGTAGASASKTHELTTAKVTVGEAEKPMTVPVTGVKVSGADSLKAGETTTLKASVEPENATDPSVTWSSSDKSVATVNADGKVTALKAGTTVITATSVSDSSIKGELKLTVTEATATVDKSALEKEIAKADGLKQSDYTADSWAAYQTALRAAQAVLKNSAAKQSDVDTALKNLQNAKLVKAEAVKPSTKPTPGKTAATTKPGADNGSQYGGNEQKQTGSDAGKSGSLSKTGVAVGVVAFAAVALAGAGVALKLRRRRA